MWPTGNQADQATKRRPIMRTDAVPIKTPDLLPARRTLEAEGVLVMSETDAVRQDIRPLRIGLLNLMPDKISTETQIARLLGATPLQIELTLVRITDHVSRNTSADHMAAFYRPWRDVREEHFDGFIITGAPVERLDYRDVLYWPELRAINEENRACICAGRDGLAPSAKNENRSAYEISVLGPVRLLPKNGGSCLRG